MIFPSSRKRILKIVASHIMDKLSKKVNALINLIFMEENNMA